MALVGSIPQRAPVGHVREDYSDRGDAWDYFTHDQARSRAYRCGADGLASLSDDKPAHLLAGGVRRSAARTAAPVIPP
jgi:hypothetical protein